VLIGAGPEEEAIRALAIREGLSQFVTILPPCGNIAKVMTNQMDVLLLPSDFEGTPRVVLEAQACGVPVVCSTAVTEDVRIVPELFHRLGLLDGPDAWAEKVLQIGTMRIPREQIAAHFAHSPCEIENQADLLLDRYHRFRNSLPRRS
jgi:glycosyltransferase involved in cell wall biosynthesis